MSGLLSFLAIFIVAATLYYYYIHSPDKKDGVPPGVSGAETAELPQEDLGIREPDQGPPIVPQWPVTGEKEKSAYQAAREGDYTRAAMEDSPSSTELKSALAKSLNRAALGEMDSGNLARAKELLTEAAVLSTDPAIIENLAGVNVKLKDLEAAASGLEPISSDPKVKRMLASIYTRLGNENYAAGRVAAAITYFEKGLSHEPGNQYLSSRIRKLKSENSVEEKMSSTGAMHFNIKFEGGENAATGHLIGLLLEGAYLKVGLDLGFYPEDTIEALLYTRESFRDTTRSPSWAGALYDGRIKIPAGGIYEKTDELEKVIYHEYTHAVVHRITGGRVPTWLNEGLAQYEEGKGSSGQKDLLRDLASSGKLKLRAFEGSFMGFNQNGARVAYLVSLSATEYMIREFGVSSVKRALESLGGGGSIDSALSSAIYMNYDEFEKSWVEYLKK